MHSQARLAPAGGVDLRVIRNGPATPGHELTLREALRYGSPRSGEAPEVNAWREENLPHLLRGLSRQGVARAAARRLGLPYFWSQLWLAKTTADGRRLNLGLAGVRVVTTAGVNAIVDAFQNTVELETFNYHGIGTDNTSEAAGDTALGAELTTQYNPNSTRATGSQGEGASANIYQTVGTNTVDAAVAITEHGIFTQAATGGGTLLDRTVFAVVNLADADSLESTYELTVAAGG